MNRRGFTLVELLVVIGIIGLLMVVSVPLFQRFARGQQLDESGRIIRTSFNHAQWAAVRERQWVRILFTRDAIGIYTKNAGFPPDWESIRLPKGCTMQYNFGERKYLDFPETFPDEDEIHAQSSPDFAGKIEFRMDGTIIFGGNFQDQPQPKVGDIRLFDPNRTISDRVPIDAYTDIVVSRRGDSKKCYIDIDPNTGRVSFRVAEAAGAKAKKKE